MKPFNLEEAKAGKPVCTGGGHKVRIICYDAKGQFPIVGLEEVNNEEVCIRRTIDGKYYIDTNTSSQYDLFMIPEKHERWINIYRHSDGDFITGSLFKTKKEAKCRADQAEKDVIATIKIEWKDDDES